MLANGTMTAANMHELCYIKSEGHHVEPYVHQFTGVQVLIRDQQSVLVMRKVLTSHCQALAALCHG